MDVTVNPELCTHCKRCIRSCPAGALTIGRDRLPKENPMGGAERCVKCQHCLACCPTGALSIFGKHPADSVVPQELPTAQSMLELIQFRRSCRHFKPENLDRAKLQMLQKAMAWSPTGVNNHNLYFACIDDLEVMNDIRNTVNLRATAAAKAAGALTGEFAVLERYRQLVAMGADVIFRGAPHLVVAAAPKKSPCPDIDPTIALSYFELLAQSLGVGTCWCGLFTAILRNGIADVRERFAIPADYQIGYTMLFGEPAWDYVRATQPEPVKIFSIK